MATLETIKSLLNTTATKPVQSKGAYWCHDCSERVPSFDVEDGESPECPSCGDAMEFERSVGSRDCAC